MSTQTWQYDVFVSYSLTEGQTADLVERALTEAGLGVVSHANVPPGADWREFLRKALAESDALVAIIDPQRTLPSVIGVEVGAALAWHKPVYVIHTTTGNVKLPSYLGNSPVYSVSRIDDAVQSIKRGLKPLSEEEQSVLASVYVELGIPLDKLLGEPASVEQLARDFSHRCRRDVSGERLVQELARLRKRGSLPRRRS